MNSQDLLVAALPFLGGWAVWVSRTITAHDAVIQKLDRLVELLLEERGRAQDKDRR